MKIFQKVIVRPFLMSKKYTLLTFKGIYMIFLLELKFSILSHPPTSKQPCKIVQIHMHHPVVLKASKSAGAKGDVSKICWFVHRCTCANELPGTKKLHSVNVICNLLEGCILHIFSTHFLYIYISE